MSQARVLADAPWLQSGPAGRVLALLNGGGEEARVIGGAVRNALLGLPVADTHRVYEDAVLAAGAGRA